MALSKAIECDTIRVYIGVSTIFYRSAGYIYIDISARKTPKIYGA